MARQVCGSSSEQPRVGFGQKWNQFNLLLHQIGFSWETAQVLFSCDKACFALSICSTCINVDVGKCEFMLDYIVHPTWLSALRAMGLAS